MNIYLNLGYEVGLNTAQEREGRGGKKENETMRPQESRGKRVSCNISTTYATTVITLYKSLYITDKKCKGLLSGY